VPELGHVPPHACSVVRTSQVSKLGLKKIERANQLLLCDCWLRHDVFKIPRSHRNVELADPKEPRKC
jgi:hypothetical protein